jgi:aryl-alcohol dehydrogenase-like predicted oxidoreductase
MTAIEQVEIGKTGLYAPPLGIGTWAWGDTMVWGFGNGYAEEDIAAAYRTSMGAGLTFLDTAEMYGFGKSEKYIGRFAAEGGTRPIVATKFFPLPWRVSRGALIGALRKSLKRLGMAQVDLYQIHWPFPPVSIETWMEGMADAVEAGMTKAVGVSNYNADQMRRAHATLARRNIPLASNQVQYSLLRREPERNGVQEACRELGVTLIAYSPLAMGLLGGKYTPENPPPGNRRRMAKPEYLAEIQPLIGLMRAIGQAHGGKTPAQVALNWTVCKGAVPIPGAKNARQALDNAGALGWRLTGDEVAALNAASDKITTKQR